MSISENKLAAAGIPKCRVPRDLDTAFETYRHAERAAGREPVNFSAFKRGER